VGRGAGHALRVAGHDDHPFSKFTCPPLTTVSQNYEAISERSVEALFALIQGTDHQGERTEVLFEGRLVMRASA
jgi:DNA-binding LacI/PurR family transcriptional regulator